MRQQLQNPLHYDKLNSDPSSHHVDVISNWTKKWLDKGQISDDIAQWVVNGNAKPGKAFGTIKTHKEGKPLRLITSCCGTTIEKLSAFTEFYLKPLAQKLPSFVKDTTHLLQKIEDLNKLGPFPKESLLVSWDVVAMFPNIDNNLGINAITEALKVPLRRNFTFYFPLFFLRRITYRHVRCPFVHKEKNKKFSFIIISPLEK